MTGTRRNQERNDPAQMTAEYLRPMM
jgi:hypothetical protein